MEAAIYLDQVAKRLASDGFAFEENVSSADDAFDLVASRQRFEITKFGAVRHFFVFKRFESIDTDGMRKYSSACWDHLVREITFRGLGRAVYCFPVALVPEIDEDTGLGVRRRTPKLHFASAEIPVVVELEAETLHYFERTPIWGFAYARGFRSMIRNYLKV